MYATEHPWAKMVGSQTGQAYSVAVRDPQNPGYGDFFAGFRCAVTSGS
jgi:hypothetical protein